MHLERTSLGNVLLSALLLVSPLPRVCAWGDEASASIEEQRRRLEALSQDELAELRRKKERFDRLSAEEQQRVRELHSDLSSDPQGERLRQVLTSYNAWLQTLTAAERAELASLPAEQRVKQIRQMQQDQRRDEASRLGIPTVTIPAEDARVVLEWIDAYLTRSQAHLEQQIPRLNERLAQVTDTRRRAAVLMFALMQTRAESGLTPPPFEPADLEQLTERLTPASRQQLASAGSSRDKFELILKWCGAAFRRQFEPTREELERFYRESLTVEDREWLDAMPRQRFQQTLRSLYFRDRQMAEGNRGFPGGRRPGMGPGPGPGGAPGGEGPAPKRPLDGRPPGGFPFGPNGPFGGPPGSPPGNPPGPRPNGGASPAPGSELPGAGPDRRGDRPRDSIPPAVRPKDSRATDEPAPAPR
ncbi:MAG: hypothetical protein U0935_20640 [Pirellulales bacterium]